jgi:hypothetical protein
MPAREFAAHIFRNCSACKTRFFAPSAKFQGAYRSAICTWLSKFHTFKISSQNYAGSKKKSYKIIIIHLFAIFDKAKHITENIGALNLAAVKPTTVQGTKLPL